MDRYKEFEKRLVKLKRIANEVKTSSRLAGIFMEKYKSNIDELLRLTRKRMIPDSQGAGCGLFKGLSDYGELESNKALFQAALEADRYYSNECKTFKD